MIQFYDSTRPVEFPPGITHAALYWDGRFAAPAGSAPGVQRRWITVIGGASAAAHTGIIDYEAGNEAYTGNQLREWAAERQMMNRRARIYCNRSDAAAALEAVRGVPALWWIATLDNHQWTVPELVADLKSNWGADIAPGDVWGNQFTDRQGRYDVSNLLGVW